MVVIVIIVILNYSLVSELHIPDVALIQLSLLMMGTWLPETYKKKTVHEVGLFTKIILRCTVNNTQHVQLSQSAPWGQIKGRSPLIHDLCTTWP